MLSDGRYVKRVFCNGRFVECCVIVGMWKECLCDRRYVERVLCDGR